MADVVWFLSAAVLAATLTGIVRRHALAHNMLDVPNARSSHTQPTPRGGGIAMVVVITSGAAVFAIIGALDYWTAGSLVIGGGAVAAIGYADDKHGLTAKARFAVHLAAAVLMAAVLVTRSGSHPIFPDLPLTVTLVLLVLGIIWSINLFNFMDGIDGIAGSQALFVAGASAGLIAADEPVPAMLLPTVTAGAIAGFLRWNWPPARIFMGDVGSGFLGFWLAATAVVLHLSGALSIWCSLTLGSIFIADATVTVVRRALSGERWYVAHRTHAYQRLARRFASHRIVTVGVWVVNLVAVLPVALVVKHSESLAPWLAMTTVIAFGAMCLAFGAGRND